jgi:hypothetical protein
MGRTAYYGSPMDPDLARKIHRTAEPYHGFVYFAPEAAAAYGRLGVEGRDGYFASRSAALGRVPAEVVIATFFNFDPRLIRHAIPAVWDVTTPDAMVMARLEAVDACLRGAIGDALDGPDVERAAALARVAADACTTPGRPLYAAHAALAWPEPPHLALWHAITLLREHRGDGHIALLVAAGVDAVEALALHAATGVVPRAALQSTRAWDDDAWDAAVARLGERGLLDADGVFTDDGKALRDRIEHETDVLALAPWEALGEERTTELRDLMRPLSRAIVDSGVFAVPR